MKILLNLFLLSVVMMTGASCASSRYVAADVVPSQMTDLARFEPFSDIAFIEKGNRAERNDSLTIVSQELLRVALTAVEARLPTSSDPGVIAYAGPATREITQEEVLGMLSQVTTKKQIKTMPVLPLLNDMVTASGKRYGLMVVQTGFSRRKGNYGGQVAKGVGLAILTAVATGGAGYASYTPLKANSTIHAFIIDAGHDKIVFYNKVTTEAEPCDPEVLSKQVDKLFRNVFW